MPLTLTAVAGPADTSCIERQLRRTSISVVQVKNPSPQPFVFTIRPSFDWSPDDAEVRTTGKRGQTATL